MLCLILFPSFSDQFERSDGFQVQISLKAADLSVRTYTMLSKNSIVLLSSVRVTTAFFQLLV